MSQISPPMRIVLVAAVAFLGIYMMFLRPKPASVEAPPPAATPAGNVNTGKAAVTGMGKAVEAAKGAAAATEAEQDAEGDSTPSGTASKPAARSATQHGHAAAKAPAMDTAGIPLPVAKAIARHKVLALLFTNGRSADDRAVQKALEHVDRLDGGVYVDAAPMKAIARYGRITRGADVEQSPTVVVVDRKLRATNLVGYVDRLTIQQAVVDAARASGGLLTDPYLRRVNKLCSSASHDLNGMPDGTTIPQLRQQLRRSTTRFDAFVHDFRTTPARQRWAGFKRATVGDLREIAHARHSLSQRVSRSSNRGQLVQAATSYFTTATPGAKRFTARVERQHLLYCGRLG